MTVARSGHAGLRAWLVALIAGVPLALTFTAPTSAAGGETTPGVTVTASNPAGFTVGSDLNITLAAHTGVSTVPYPSWRPEDMTLECVDPPVQAQANGVAVVKWPDNTGLPGGTKVQPGFTFTDNGRGQYENQFVIKVNRLAEAPGQAAALPVGDPRRSARRGSSSWTTAPDTRFRQRVARSA